MLSNRQQKQENAYAVPYHWFTRDGLNESGRLYFGYIGFCIRQMHGNVILDAGCGDGRLLGEIVRSGKTDGLYGVDYSERAIGFARLLVPQATFARADLRHLPYDDGFFDTIYLIETLEHIPPAEIPPLLAEIGRVLKKNGKLIITVPSIRSGTPGPNSKHYQHFSPETLRAAVASRFYIEGLHGQDKTGFHPLKVLYRLFDNKLWDLKPLRRWYNANVWPKLFNICAPEKGRRLIAVCVTKSD